MSTAALVLIPVLLVAAQWLPPAVEQGLAAQLAERLAVGGPASSKDAAAARAVVSSVGKRLGSWTDAVAIERAPSFPQLKLPSAGEKHLDAIARYQVCNMVLFVQFESGADAERRRRSALGLTAITMAVVRLRHPFVAAGGSDERMEAFLTGAAMQPVLDAIQQKPELAAHVDRQCASVLRALLD